jgi:ATP-dependent DNA helicase RecG
MPTQQELLEMIAGGESDILEFKRDDIRPERLAREIAAMANEQGGIILLGVEDSGEISGITRKNLQEWTYDTVLGRYVFPRPNPSYREIEIEGKRVAVLTLECGDSKPYVARNNEREDIYIRQGCVTRLASRDEQRRLFERGGLLHSECLPVSTAFFNVLDKARLENYLRDIIRDPEIPSSNAEWIERLTGLGLMTQDSNGNDVCTVAGVVLFGAKPRRFLRQAGLRVMVFEGLDKDYLARLDSVLDAPLVGRWQVDKSGRTLIDEGLIEKFAESIAPFISREAAEIDENMRREKTWFYPTEAIRETVINALAHRDWTRTVDVEVSAYADRLEVISPGSFQNSMTIEKMKAGQRSTRNQIIVEILRDYGYVDARGMGVRTKVIPLMRARGMDPVFEATDDFVKTVLGQTSESLRPSDQKPVDYSSPEAPQQGQKIRDKGSDYAARTIIMGQRATQDDLLRVLRDDPNADYLTIATALGVSPATVKRRIQKLKKAFRLRRVGSKKTGYWEVVD